MSSFPLWDAIRKNHESPLQRELAIMRDIPLFDGIPVRGLRVIRSQCHVRQFKDGEHIFRTSEPGVGMYIILEGRVRIYSTRSGHEETLAEFDQGDFFGELALLEETPRTASAISEGYSRMLGFFRPDLDVIIKRNPGLANLLLLNIARVTGRRLINTTEILDRTLYELNQLRKKGS
jgi:CRP-like cAMP-binding protein